MKTQLDTLGGKILIVDDQEVNILLLERMLRGAGYRCITSTTDPTEVCALHRENCYDLILLDLQMPNMDGFEVIEGLKRLDPVGYLPVLVVTAQPGHKLRALQAGAKDFVSKPFEIAEVLARVANMLEVRLLHSRLQNQNEVLEQQVALRTAELRSSYLETIFTVTRAAEHRDEDTGTHLQRISVSCSELARILGLDRERVEAIYFASPMHDIGKISVPDHVLLKQGVLTPDEWEVMKMHTVDGARILEIGTSPYLKLGAAIALNHHERWGGGGYPNGIRGEAIPLEARVMMLCDIYDALRSKRPYKVALDHATVVGIITKGDGRTQPEHFDPEVLSAFKQNHTLFRDIFDEFAA